MTDEQLAKYLGIESDPKAIEVIANLSSSKRAVYERMAELETEIELWQRGLGPKPKGVLIDAARTPSQARSRVNRIKGRWPGRNPTTTSK